MKTKCESCEALAVKWRTKRDAARAHYSAQLWVLVAGFGCAAATITLIGVFVALFLFDASSVIGTIPSYVALFIPTVGIGITTSMLVQFVPLRNDARRELAEGPQPFNVVGYFDATPRFHVHQPHFGGPEYEAPYHFKLSFSEHTHALRGHVRWGSKPSVHEVQLLQESDNAPPHETQHVLLADTHVDNTLTLVALRVLLDEAGDMHFGTLEYLVAHLCDKHENLVAAIKQLRHLVQESREGGNAPFAKVVHLVLEDVLRRYPHDSGNRDLVAAVNASWAHHAGRVHLPGAAAAPHLEKVASPP